MTPHLFVQNNLTLFYQKEFSLTYFTFFSYFLETGLFKNTHDLYESFFPLIPTATSLGSLSPFIRILTGFVAN